MNGWEQRHKGEWCRLTVELGGGGGRETDGASLTAVSQIWAGRQVSPLTCDSAVLTSAAQQDLGNSLCV